MGGASSLNKGKRGEREIVKLLQPLVDVVYSEFPQLGAAPKLLRNTLQSAVGGYDIIGLEWMAPEVKFHKTLNINSWWKQTTAQAAPEQIPVLFYRCNNKPWRVVMKMFSPVGDKRFFCKADITLPDFLLFFEHRLRAELHEKAQLLESLPGSMVDVEEE